MISGGRLTLVEGGQITTDTTSPAIWLAPWAGGDVFGVPYLSGPDDQVGKRFDVQGHAPLTDYRLFLYGSDLCSAPMVAGVAPPAAPSGTPGLLAGTAIGGMTGGGGLAGGLGANVNNYAACAISPGGFSGYAAGNRIGLDFGAGAAVVLTGFTINSPTDDGFRGDGYAAIGYKIQYTDDGTTWADLASGTTPFGSGTQVDVQSGLPATPHRGYAVVLSGNGTNWVRVGRAKFFGYTPSGTPAPPPSSTGASLAWRNGIRVNADTITGKTNTGSVTIPAREGFDIGAFRTDASGNTVTAHRLHGPKRVHNFWRRYNQEEIRLSAGILAPATLVRPQQPTGYNPAPYYPTWGPLANDDGNRLTIFRGEAQGIVRVALEHAGHVAATPSNSQYFTGIGFNSTTVPSGTWGQWDVEGMDNERNGWCQTASFDVPMLAGAQNCYALESRGGPGFVAAWVGVRDSKLSASWWG